MLQPNPVPRGSGPSGRLGSGAAPPDPRPGVAEINPTARGGQASPFSRLLADAPDIVAKRGVISLPGLQAIKEVGRPFLPSLPFSQVRTKGGGQLRLGWVPMTRRCGGTERTVARRAA